ncbi:Uma2 family endonuclease [Mitsuaria sp. GD03876]|uniref:Uma2 family endonuclease n=1 Tax=Mitsuaria sp. GD03876 TaxID=2975399 RepID=UPI002449143D|nr:Uma2 family endonuclease [Mitsuaria sp. GD03876]MDH0865523.1 Uma2 family endonuclease [Mitsuaria sp. GD03876]
MAYPLSTTTTMRMTTDEFLVWDSQDDKRYELIDGFVVVMETGIDRHQTVSGNLWIEFRQHLKGTACTAYFGLAVHVDESNCLVPDVFVTCGKEDQAKPRGKSNVPLVVEVLSPSTQSFDRKGKFARYRRMTALREYMLVDVEKLTTEVHRRCEDGAWEVFRYTAADVVHLASIDLAVAGEVVFANLERAA